MLGLLRAGEQLLGRRSGHDGRARKVILFTDMIGSTTFNVHAGDVAYVELLRAHDRVVRTRYDVTRASSSSTPATASRRGPRRHGEQSRARSPYTTPHRAFRRLRRHGAGSLRTRRGRSDREGGDLFGLSVRALRASANWPRAGWCSCRRTSPRWRVGAEFRFTDRGPVENFEAFRAKATCSRPTPTTADTTDQDTKRKQRGETSHADALHIDQRQAFQGSRTNAQSAVTGRQDKPRHGPEYV